MHRLWTFDDVKYQVAECLVDKEFLLGTPMKGMYRSLHSFALVSKSFKDPVITFLWRDIPTLVPILKLMPSVVFDTRNPEYVKSTKAGFPMPNDWPSVVYYSSKVHILRVSEKFADEGTVRRIFNVFLHHAKQKKPVFRNVQELETNISAELAHYIPAFSSPYLHTLTLRPHHESYPSLRVLHSASTIPTVSKLILCQSMEESYLNNYMSAQVELEHTLSGFHQLSLLQSTIPISPKGVETLSRLRTLLTLNANLNAEPMETARFNSTSFPTLETCAVTGFPTSIKVLVSSFTSRDLRKMALDFEEAQEGPEAGSYQLSTIFAAIGTLPSASRIEELEIGQSVYTLDASDSIPATSLRSLQNLSNIKTVNISPIASLQDADFKFIAQSWPKLENLDLGSEEVIGRESSPPTRVTVEAFKALSTLKYLKRLNIFLTDLRAPASRDINISSSSPLEYLEMYVGRPFPAAIPFAQLIATTFPHLRTFFVEGTDPFGMDHDFYHPSILLMGRRFHRLVPSATFECAKARLTPV